MMILSNIERTLFKLFDGFLNSFAPQYTVRGNEIMPIQVIRVPEGMELSLSKAIVSKEEPVARSITTTSVRISAKEKSVVVLLIVHIQLQL